MARVSNVEPIELYAAREDSGYVLALRDDVLVTSIGGHAMRHESPDLIEHTISEFVRYPEITIKNGQIEEPAFFGAYRLFGLQKEFIEPRTDNVTEAFAFELFTDPTLRPPAGPERRDSEARYGPLDLWLNEQGLRRVDTDFVDSDTVPVPEGIEYLQLSGDFGVKQTGGIPSPRRSLAGQVRCAHPRGADLRRLPTQHAPRSAGPISCLGRERGDAERLRDGRHGVAQHAERLR